MYITTKWCLLHTFFVALKSATRVRSQVHIVNNDEPENSPEYITG
jgi:hypothetical protein